MSELADLWLGSTGEARGGRPRHPAAAALAYLPGFERRHGGGDAGAAAGATARDIDVLYVGKFADVKGARALFASSIVFMMW